MPAFVQLIDAKPGFSAVIVNAKTGEPEFHPIVLWGLIEEADERDDDCEECGECAGFIRQGIVGLIVPSDRVGYTLQPAYLCDGCLGIAAPGDTKELWVTRAGEYLAMKAAGMLDADKEELPQKWN